MTPEPVFVEPMDEEKATVKMTDGSVVPAKLLTRGARQSNNVPQGHAPESASETGCGSIRVED